MKVSLRYLFAVVILTLSSTIDARFISDNQQNEQNDETVSGERDSAVDRDAKKYSSVVVQERASGEGTVLKLTADDMIYKLYIDGHAYAVPHRSTVKTLGSVKIPKNSRMIAIECLNLQDKAGILAFAKDESLLTDSSWKCTASDQPLTWMLPNFDDRNWPAAVVLKHSAKLNEVIPKNAKWIWAKNYKKRDSPVYCRGRFKLSESEVAHASIIKKLDGILKRLDSVEDRLAISSVAFSPEQKQLASALTSKCIPLLILQNVDGSKFFHRTWKEYKQGFNSSNGNLWIGNELISQLTTRDHYMLRIDLQSKKTGKWYYAKYSSFVVHPESTQYTMHYSGYSGNAGGDSFAYQNGMKFSTYDKDNDKWKSNCAKSRFGGFWYKDCDWFVPTAANGHEFTWDKLPGGRELETCRMWLTCR